MKRFTVVDLEIMDQKKYDEIGANYNIGHNILTGEMSYPIVDKWIGDDVFRIKLKETTDDKFRSGRFEFSVWFKTPYGKKHIERFNSEYEAQIASDHFLKDLNVSVVYLDVRELSENEFLRGWVRENIE